MRQDKCLKKYRLVRSESQLPIQKPFSVRINIHFLTLIQDVNTFPSSWKCSKVFPLYKSGDRANASNYRPISVLPALSKLMEKAVYTQLYDYLSENNILNDNQFGFRRKCSTTTALSSFADEILASMEKGEVCGAVFWTCPRPSTRSITLLC